MLGKCSKGEAPSNLPSSVTLIEGFRMKKIHYLLMQDRFNHEYKKVLPFRRYDYDITLYLNPDFEEFKKNILKLTLFSFLSVDEVV